MAAVATPKPIRAARTSAISIVFLGGVEDFASPHKHTTGMQRYYPGCSQSQIPCKQVWLFLIKDEALHIENGKSGFLSLS